LKRWRTLIENDAVTEDWRTMLHPSTSANLSTSAKLGAKEPVAESVLTKKRADRAPETDPPQLHGRGKARDRARERAPR
jgi:hypothetical protein